MTQHKFTRADIEQFIREKITRPDCPTCGKNDWSLQGFENDLIANIPLSKQGNACTIPQPHIPVFLMICHNCGYIRHHSLIIAMNWKSSKLEQEHDQ